jgi:predicted glycosyltransferase
MIVSIAGCREFDTVILAGPLVANARIRELTMRTAGLPVRIEHFVPDVSQLMQEADLVVSMGGYNSIAEILSHARRALIIPRESPRREQLMRATRLQELGLVQLLRQSDLTTTALWHAIRGAMRSQALPLAEARLHGTLPLDGATRIVSLLSSGARRRRQGIPKENTSE